MVRIQISLEPKEAGWLKRLAGIVGRLIRTTSAEENRSTASGKTSALNKGGTISSRFPFVGCLKDGRESDAKLAKGYLYGEGDMR